MGVIQNSMNQALGTTGAIAAIGLNEKAKSAELESEIASSEQKKAEALQAYRNDTVEAATAIGAHEAEFNPVVGNKNFKDLSATDLSKLTDAEIAELGKEVDAFRSGKMTTDRIKRMTDAAAMGDDEVNFVQGENGTEMVTKNDYLKAAYESYRELNNRQAASRELKFDINREEAKIKALKNKDKGILQRGGNL